MNTMTDEQYAKVEAYLNERIREVKAANPMDYVEEVFDKVKAERIARAKQRI
jgi:hypothetical protein